MDQFNANNQMDQITTNTPLPPFYELLPSPVVLDYDRDVLILFLNSLNARYERNAWTSKLLASYLVRLAGCPPSITPNLSLCLERPRTMQSIKDQARTNLGITTHDNQRISSRMRLIAYIMAILVERYESDAEASSRTIWGRLGFGPCDECREKGYSGLSSFFRHIFLFELPTWGRRAEVQE